MKVTVCFFIVALVVCIEVSQSASTSRSRRGFRMGAADRFSHGFGKRGGDEDIFASGVEGNEDFVMSVDDMADLIRSDPRLALTFVKRFIDVNDDNMVSRHELFAA